MSVLVQMSDPHFGTENPAVTVALKRLIEAIRPQCVLLSGDITQRARRAEFDAAQAFCASLPCPVVAIPGNHDIPLFNVWARMFRPYAGFQRVFGSDLEPVWESAGMRIVCANSTTPRRHKDGELTPAAVQRICEQVRTGDRAKLHIVALHHPLHVITESDRENLLHGHREALHAFADAGVDLVLGGHIHLAYVRALREHIPSLSRELWVVQAGTAISTRVRNDQPNSVHVIRTRTVDNRPGTPVTGCDVEQWDHSAGDGQFVRVRVTPMDRQLKPTLTSDGTESR
jgi:3',5'-cyclic AMP phosphodiesterase CpdA